MINYVDVIKEGKCKNNIWHHIAIKLSKYCYFRYKLSHKINI